MHPLFRWEAKIKQALLSFKSTTQQYHNKKIINQLWHTLVQTAPIIQHNCEESMAHRIRAEQEIYFISAMQYLSTLNQRQVRATQRTDQTNQPSTGLLHSSVCVVDPWHLCDAKPQSKRRWGWSEPVKVNEKTETSRLKDKTKCGITYQVASPHLGISLSELITVQQTDIYIHV